MSEEYTPTLIYVRSAYVDTRYNMAAYQGKYPPPVTQRFAEFDRWLDQVKADAWDEAIEHVSQIEADVGFMEHYKRHNPYRKQEEA